MLGILIDLNLIFPFSFYLSATKKPFRYSIKVSIQPA
jgi:hypothetical protein